MLKIGDFSKLSQVSVKTLRYYDEVGLLKPVEVDRFTGYRYYSFDQLPRLNRILALKDLGFSLEQIARALDEGISPDQLRGMLRLKRAEIQQQVEEEQERLERVEARLRQIEMEATMSNYDVVLKKVTPLRVAAIRDVIPTYSQQGHLWNELYAYLGQRRLARSGPCLTLYYDEEYKERDVDAEVCQPVSGAQPVEGRVKVYDLPGVETMACVVHHGPFTTIGEAYTALTKWIEANGYRIAGPGREAYLQPPAQSGSQTDPNTVTEIQFPVEKA
jgi:effector-binding domain-containing protein